MLIALILIFISIFCILFVVGREPIPWTHRLRRIHAGVSRKAEWVAPDDVVHQVTADYLDALEWLTSAALGEQTHRAPQFLAGRFLTRFQTIINYQNGLRRIDAPASESCLNPAGLGRQYSLVSFWLHNRQSCLKPSS